MTTVLVTGGTSGIGEAVVRQLRARGSRVLFTGRDEARGEELAKETGARFRRVDFARLADVRALADEVLAEEDRLDVLVNNAGAFLDEHRVTEDGFEATMQVNHLAHFALTLRLLPLMEKSAPARVVNTSSEMHWRGKLDAHDLRLDDGYGFGVNAYARSKLANVLFTRALARRLDPAKVTVNAVHPGVVDTRLGRGNRRLAGIGWNLVKRLGRKPATGADTLVWAATSRDLDGVTGKYFADREEADVSSAARDDALAEALWRESERATGISL